MKKNIRKSTFGILLNIPKKTTDKIKVWLYLVELGLKKDLAPIVEKKMTYLWHVCYTLSKEKNKKFGNFLANLKVLNGYSSNFTNII